MEASTGMEASRFNVAASIKMRKYHILEASPLQEASLQCGRIYKDAEMKNVKGMDGNRIISFNVAASIKMRKSLHRRPPTFWGRLLQCGRIYKDAEIRNRL